MVNVNCGFRFPRMISVITLMDGRRSTEAGGRLHDGTGNRVPLYCGKSIRNGFPQLAIGEDLFLPVGRGHCIWTLGMVLFRRRLLRSVPTLLSYIISYIKDTQIYVLDIV